MHDAVNYIRISRKARSAINEVLKKSSERNLKEAKSFYKEDFWNNKEQRIKEHHSDLMQKSYENAIKKRPELIKDGYKVFKENKNIKIKEIIRPSTFYKPDLLPDPIEYFRLHGRL